MITRHTDREFQAELDDLRDRLLRMAGRVEEMISGGVRAVVERDVDLARQVIEMDRRVNQDEVETDELCLTILARRQPLASDLRFITLALKMVTDLERVGDLVVNICERAIELCKEPAMEPIEAVPQMATAVQRAMKDAIDAFVRRDAELALKVIARDDEIDELYHRVIREILARMTADGANIQRGIHTQAVAKFIERIGDHATNIAEEVVFLVKGKDIRHVGKRSGEAV